MKRGEIWLTEVDGKQRPVVLLTRAEVIDVRELVTVAEVTTTIRGIATEVAFDFDEVGLDRESVVNCDGIHTVAQRRLTAFVGELDEPTLSRICSAVHYALGC